MIKIELENRTASGCWHYIKSRANIKWTLGKIWAAGACQRPDILYISMATSSKNIRWHVCS